MGARNFNAALKFSKNGNFQPQILYYWKKMSREVIFRLAKMGGGQLPPPLAPLRDDTGEWSHVK